jgi:phospholipase C
MTGQNIGDLLNAKGVTWGWFQGGFAPTTVRHRDHPGRLRRDAHEHRRRLVADYSAHHDPFEYYAVDGEPAPPAPKPRAEIGHNGQANHQYDLS